MVSRSDVNEATGVHELYRFSCDCDEPSEVLRYEGEHYEIATADGEDICFNGGSIRFAQNKQNQRKVYMNLKRRLQV